MTQKNKGNLKAKKSQSKISHALIELMKEKPYETITISELSERADLSRRTFYRNYSTKDDIINEFFYKIWSEYSYEIKQEDDLSLPHIALIFFNKMDEYGEILNLFNQNDLFVLFLNSIPELMIESYKSRDNKIQDISPTARQFVARFVSGGFFMVAKSWFDNGREQSPEELAQYVANMNIIY